MIRPDFSYAHRRIAVDLNVDVDIDGFSKLDRLRGSGECSRGVLGYGILVLLKNPLAGGFVLERDPARVEKDREPVPRALNGNLRAVAP